LIEGEVTLRISSREDNSIEKITGHVSVFGTNLLFGVNRYLKRARVTKTSKILVIDA